MILALLLVTLFPLVLITMCSLPVFLWVKHKTQGALAIYLFSGISASLIISGILVLTIEYLTGEPVGYALEVSTVSLIYGVFLGSVAKHFDKRIRDD